MNLFKHLFSKTEDKSNTVRIVFLSDTHSKHNSMKRGVPHGDILIHAGKGEYIQGHPIMKKQKNISLLYYQYLGDFTIYSKPEQLQDFRKFLRSQPHRHKIVIAGNHDFGLDIDQYDTNFRASKHHNKVKLDPKAEIELMKQCCTYLDHKWVEIEGVYIFGSPYQPFFHDWGFNYDTKLADSVWKPKLTAKEQADQQELEGKPPRIDIVVTHGPPYSILDEVQWTKEKVGCPSLLKLIETIKPKVHAFGHIHQAYGKQMKDGTLFLNASICNLNYEPVNRPWVVDFNKITREVKVVEEN